MTRTREETRAAFRSFWLGYTYPCFLPTQASGRRFNDHHIGGTPLSRKSGVCRYSLLDDLLGFSPAEKTPSLVLGSISLFGILRCNAEERNTPPPYSFFLSFGNPTYLLLFLCPFFCESVIYQPPVQLALRRIAVLRSAYEVFVSVSAPTRAWAGWLASTWRRESWRCVYRTEEMMCGRDSNVSEGHDVPAMKVARSALVAKGVRNL